MTLHIQLTPEIEHKIDDLIAKGIFSNRVELVRHGIRETLREFGMIDAALKV